MSWYQIPGQGQNSMLLNCTCNFSIVIFNDFSQSSLKTFLSPSLTEWNDIALLNIKLTTKSAPARICTIVGFVELNNGMR